MIARVKTLYRHLLRRNPGEDEDELDHRITQIRHPLAPVEYVEAFGIDHSGAARKVRVADDGTKVIVPLDEEDFATTFENESRAEFSPSDSSGAGEGGN